MNDWSRIVCDMFLRDREAVHAVKPLLEAGTPLCILSTFIEEYTRQAIAVFSFDSVQWDEVGNYLLMEHYGAREVDSLVPEWSDRFDQSEY